MSTQEFNAQLTKEFSLSTQQIEALNRLGVNDLTDFVHVTEENLVGCGIALITARKILSQYKDEQKATAAAPAPAPTPPAPAAPVVDPMAMLQQVMTMMAQSQAGTNNALTQLATSMTAQDKIACGSCGALVDKNYEGETCPICGLLFTNGISECAVCLTPVPKTVRNAVKCVNPECRCTLYAGDDALAIRHLIHAGDSVRAAEQALAAAKTSSAKELAVWVAQGRKLQGPVLRTTAQARELAGQTTAQQYSTQRRAGIQVTW